MDESHKKADLAKAIDKAPRFVEYLTNIGVIVPEIKPSPGRGAARLYSKKNLVQAAMVKPLKDAGLSYAWIKGLYTRIDGSLYRDFFINDDYGSKYEVLFIYPTVVSDPDDLEKYGWNALYRIKRGADGKFPIPDYPNKILWGETHKEYLGFVILFLGRIKMAAIEETGI